MSKNPERDEFIFNIFVNACEDGCYAGWRHLSAYHWTKNGELSGEDILGFSVRVHDDEDDKVYSVGRATIVRGLNVILKGKPETLHLHPDYIKTIAGASHMNDASDIDAELADYVLQAGLFGEVIYS